MNEFVTSIRTRFGDGAALVAELWLRFYLFGIDTEARESPDYRDLVKAQMTTVTKHMSLSASVFKTIINESDTFAQTYGQTLH